MSSNRATVAMMPTPISPLSGPTQWLFQGLPAESQFLAAKEPNQNLRKESHGWETSPINMWRLRGLW